MAKRVLQKIYLDPAAKAALEELAISRGQSVSDLARNALMDLLGPVAEADKAPQPMRPRRGSIRQHYVVVRFNDLELQQLEGLAQRVNLTRSAVVRRIVTGTTLPAPGNADAIIDLMKVNADLARLGNLLKLALDDDGWRAPGSTVDVEALLLDLAARQNELKAVVDGLT